MKLNQAITLCPEGHNCKMILIFPKCPFCQPLTNCRLAYWRTPVSMVQWLCRLAFHKTSHFSFFFWKNEFLSYSFSFSPTLVVVEKYRELLHDVQVRKAFLSLTGNEITSKRWNVANINGDIFLATTLKLSIVKKNNHVFKEKCVVIYGKWQKPLPKKR